MDCEKKLILNDEVNLLISLVGWLWFPVPRQIGGIVIAIIVEKCGKSSDICGISLYVHRSYKSLKL